MAEYTGSDLCALTALEIRDMLRDGTVSQVEVLDASFIRIAQTEPAQNAMVTLCVDRARAAQVKTDSLLAGMPIGVKDLTPVAGVRTTYGTIGLTNNIPKTSAPIVERMESNGAVVVGKTNTPEMGAGANTFNDVFGATGNPYDRSRNAGGSSGGAASGLATGQVWLSHGSDYGGSLRTPAAYCGVVGLRPTPGRCGGSQPLAFEAEGVQGPMARNVTDCALFLDAMSGFDAASPISFPAHKGIFLKAAQTPADSIRIGWLPDLSGHAPVEDDVAAVLLAALAQVERAGSIVEEITLDTSGLDACFRTLRGVGFLASSKMLPESVTRHFKATIKQNATDGAALTAQHMANASVTRARLFNAATVLLGEFDVLACPVVGLAPMPLEDEYPAAVAGVSSRDYLDWLGFSNLATVTHLPAMSLPVGLMPNGMPMGIQLIGPNRGEAKLLATARHFERVLNLPLTPIDPQ